MSVQEDFLLTEQPLGSNPSGMTSLEQAIGLNNRIGLFGVFNTHDVVEPGFLTHGIHVDLFAAKLLDHVDGAIVIRAREPAGMILLAFEALSQQRSVNPRDGRAVAFHPDEQGVHVSDFAMHVPIQFRRDVARVGGKEKLVFIKAEQVSSFGQDVEIALGKPPVDAAGGRAACAVRARR